MASAPGSLLFGGLTDFIEISRSHSSRHTQTHFSTASEGERLEVRVEPLPFRQFSRKGHASHAAVHDAFAWQRASGWWEATPTSHVEQCEQRTAC